MKVFVTGIKGQLGFDVMNELEKRGHEAVGTDVEELDITDAEAVGEFISRVNPDAVIHCAAWTAVDAAEDEENIDEVRAVNASGTENIAKACKKLDCKMIYISTDYVFDGRGTEPFETDSPKAPCNFYGKTKLEGETEAARLCKRLFIVRISWVFGENGKNFVKTMLRLAAERSEISVVCDQTGSPTYTKDLAVLLCEMISGCKYGVYHATNEGICSWAEFADKIMELSKSETKIIPIPSSQYKSAAVRPANSRLSKSSLDRNGFSRLPHWEDALQRFLGIEK